MNKPLLKTCLTPSALSNYNLKDYTVVVIDIFRATSTISAALDNGAKAVIPVETVEECMSIQNENKAGILTGGERNGMVIPGLQYGNSPLEYKEDVVKDKILALTTTNGTKLLHKAIDAKEIIIGSFLNIDALCEYLILEEKNVILACAGWRGLVNLEDSLFAGAVINKIGSKFDISCDSSLIALTLFRESENHKSIFDFLKTSAHFERLKSFGLLADIKYCCTPNTHPVVPKFKAPYIMI